jgi:hypothetical protein
MMTWTIAARRAADACDALGLATQAHSLRFARTTTNALRLAIKAEEAALAIHAALGLARRTAPDYARYTLDEVRERAESLMTACADLTEAIETDELVGA